VAVIFAAEWDENIAVIIEIAISSETFLVNGPGIEGICFNFYFLKHQFTQDIFKIQIYLLMHR
jgi:hypothetical protein